MKKEDKYIIAINNIEDRIKSTQHDTLSEVVDKLGSDIAMEIINDSKTENTWRTYKNGILDYMRWSDKEQPFPITPVQVISYLKDRSKTSAPSTLSNRLSAISTFSALLGYEDPSVDKLVKMTISGIRRKKIKGDAEKGVLPWSPKRASALSFEDYLKLLSVIEKDTKAGARDCALIEMGMWGSFRDREIATLQKGRLIIQPDYIIIPMGQTKADQENTIKKPKVIPRLNKEIGIEPYSSIMNWVETNNFKDTDYLFQRISKTGKFYKDGKALSSRAVNDIIIKYAKKAKISYADKISFHSLRATFVTVGRMLDMSDAKIMQQTHHTNSRTLDIYDRPEDNPDKHPINELIEKIANKYLEANDDK